MSESKPTVSSSQAGGAETASSGSQGGRGHRQGGRSGRAVDTEVKAEVGELVPATGAPQLHLKETRTA
jgi:hypothetical protein